MQKIGAKTKFLHQLFTPKSVDPSNTATLCNRLLATDQIDRCYKVCVQSL